jgi:regulatory protein
VQLAVRYLARLDRTEVQVEAFLRRKGATSTQAKRTIERLKRLTYLDDASYARRWIETRLARRPMGRERLKAELLAKGLSERLVDEAVRVACRGVSEHELAVGVLKSQKRSGSDPDLGRAVRVLRRRGFAEDTIETVVGRLGRDDR